LAKVDNLPLLVRLNNGANIIKAKCKHSFWYLGATNKFLLDTNLYSNEFAEWLKYYNHYDKLLNQYYAENPNIREINWKHPLEDFYVNTEKSITIYSDWINNDCDLDSSGIYFKINFFNYELILADRFLIEKLLKNKMICITWFEAKDIRERIIKDQEQIKVLSFINTIQEVNKVFYGI